MFFSLLVGLLLVRSVPLFMPVYHYYSLYPVCTRMSDELLLQRSCVESHSLCCGICLVESAPAYFCELYLTVYLQRSPAWFQSGTVFPVLHPPRRPVIGRQPVLLFIQPVLLFISFIKSLTSFRLWVYL